MTIIRNQQIHRVRSQLPNQKDSKAKYLWIEIENFNQVVICGNGIPSW